MSSQYAPSQPRGVGARSLPPLDMSGLGNNLPPLPPSTSPSYTSATRPRPTFNSTTAAGIKSQQYNSSYNSPSQSTFSPYSPIPPVNIHSSTSSAPHHQLPPAPPPATSLESRGSWQQQQGPSGEQQGFVGAAPSATAMHQRPLPTPPPVLSPTSTTSSGKRPNPLEDLIYTETLYVDDLGVIIKRVAGAWSRSNFPPPALDSMFRAVEAVYRINKSLLAKLNEIGPNPSSPKALGDLLMRWITDLSPAYTRYSTTFQVDFDAYDAVQSNVKLGPILSALTWPNTLPLPPSSPDTASPSLDQLFLLPVVRLSYYKKLYTKLLKSTQEGRSDHALLLDANEQLDHLVARCEEAKSRSVVLENGGTLPLKLSPSLRKPAMLEERLPEPEAAPAPASASVGVALGGPRSEERSSGESGRAASSSSSYRSSAATGTTNNTSAATHLASSYTAPPRIEDLERRLSTDRVLDIFTMLPKKCKLQMAPPHLPFTRHIRRSADVSISFVPLSDPTQREVHIPNAYIFLLTDLFLVCQRMTPEERHQHEGEADMWLLYPPLAGKHLRVTQAASGRKDELEVRIMKKETLTIRVEDGFAAREWKNVFEEATAFGAQQGLSVRSDSTSSRSPMSPTSPPPSSALSSFPGRDALSPTFGASPLSATFASTSNGSLSSSPYPSPEPKSPHVVDSQQDPRMGSAAGVGYGAPPAAPQQGQYGGGAERERRAFSAGPSSAPPPRGASMYKGAGYQSSTSLSNGQAPSPVPHSPAYPPQDFGRGGSSPAPGQLFNSNGYGSTNGRSYSPHEAQPNGYGPPSSTSSDFAPLPPPPHQPYGTYPATRQQQQQQQYEYAPPVMSGARPQRTNSGRSNGSYTSGRTDRSSSYPEPPPLPGKMGIDRERFGASTPGSNESYGGGGGGGMGRMTAASSRTGSGLLSPGGSIYRSQSAEGLRESNHYRMPSAAMQEERSNSAPGSAQGGSGGGGRFGLEDDSPPPSPLDKAPEQTTIVAQMRSKIFLRQNLGQWKSLGTGKLKLFLSTPSHTKQLVVDSDKGNPPKTIISTIVLTDGVERVGKTGVAVELSNGGSRTGIVYMLQMKTEQAATGLFDQLLLGSDRKRITR